MRVGWASEGTAAAPGESCVHFRVTSHSAGTLEPPSPQAAPPGRLLGSLTPRFVF